MPKTASVSVAEVNPTEEIWGDYLVVMVNGGTGEVELL